MIDLGCGAGFDVFLAANKLGPNGKAIGVDMNKVIILSHRGHDPQLTCPRTCLNVQTRTKRRRD